MTTQPQKQTEAILNALKEYHKLDKLNPYDIFINYGPSKEGSKLTKKGFELMKPVFTCYKVKFEDGFHLLAKHHIILERAMKFPYFLTKSYIHLFSEQDAFLLQLNGSNLDRWGDSNGVVL